MTESLPEQVSTAPVPLLKMLQQRLLPIRSLWFPTPKELRAWDQTGVPLYVRASSASTVQIGPRLQSMWAACFSPQLHGRITEYGAGSRLTWQARFPRFTLGLLFGWWVVLVAWPLAAWQSDDDPARWGPFWAFLLLCSTLGPAAGWWFGMAALRDALPWLRETLEQPPVEEDW
ncbi:MAG: hypothetical protein KTR31_03240 [Myxococcales bacterium]|nr:hypothetical protein [Myxococcales bacterium]